MRYKLLTGFLLASLFVLAPLRSSIAVYGVNADGKDRSIRVCVVNNKDSFELEIKGGYAIEPLHTHDVLERSRSPLKNAIVTPTNSGIKIGDKEYLVYAISIIPNAGVNVDVNKRRFRGTVDIIRTKNMKILVVNHVDIEEYLYGVLYHENPHYWPMETLMAQAIVARTFALYRKSEMKGSDYDLTSDTFSQMYGGKTGERWRTKWAVDLTKGKVLTYKGEILPSYYHAICGGHTEDASKLWKVNSPALKGVSCPYCTRAPYYNWKAMYSYKQIEERLNKYGIKCNKITYIVEGPKDASGRLETVRIKDAGGVKNIPTDKFRLALGSMDIKSAFFTIKITPKGIIFSGHGWGHGVGMCQWGAFGMARRGYDHRKILEFYYPGSEIKTLW